VYILDIDVLRVLLHTKIEVSRWRLSKVLSLNRIPKDRRDWTYYHLQVVLTCGNLRVGTLVPASSLDALHQLLSHDSNKNRSQVVISGNMSSQQRLHDTPARSTAVHQPSVSASSTSNLSSLLPTQLTSSSTEQSRLDQTDSWPTPTTAKHFNMPTVVRFL